MSKKSKASPSLKAMIKRISLEENLIVTPKVERFLMANPDWTVGEENADLLKELVMAQQRDRTKSFSGSSAGACPRAQIFGYEGVPQRTYIDTTLLQIFRNGTWVHLRWQMMLLEAGILDDIEVPLPYPNDWNLKGSMDGVGTDKKYGEYMFELKGWSAVVDSPIDYHVEQMHRYMLGAGIDVGVLLYENKMSQTHKEFIIDYDTDIGFKVEDELDMLNLHVVNESLPPILDVCKAMKGPTFTGCRYRKVCHDLGEWDDMDGVK